ncbi:MAG: ATP-binding protein [Erysipelotrichaceae bacterium]|nr:ATP-binding protein [Erysipelotrichaceae bacterium]
MIMFYLFDNVIHKDIMSIFLDGCNNWIEFKNSYKANTFKSSLCSLAIEYGFTGNIWQSFLIYSLMFNDNAYTRSIERNINASTFNLVDFDLETYYKMYTYKLDLQEIENFDYCTRTTDISKIVNEIKNDIKDINTFKSSILNFYKTKGLADMAIYKAFRVEDGVLSPIYNVLDVSFNDLIGYDYQKSLLIENTECFINGKPCNNVLLYGESGTGKSTSIKALLNTYYAAGLRIIEVYKHQMEEISKIIHTLRARPYHYIIYMDDLSFEEDEIEYKYLKSIIEGGIEPKPNNVVIYATSNRRHLIKETSIDNLADDLHRNETQAEKLSLAYRFGLQIYYSSLSPKEFRAMVKELANKNDIKVEESILIQEASKWELKYGSLSGRCAAQFISYLVNKYQ